MFDTMRPALAAFVCLGLFTALGCGPRKVTGIAGGGPTWHIAAEDPIPGIHDGTLSIITLRFGPPTGVTVAFWGDVSVSKTAGATRDDHAFMEGTFFKADGTAVQYRCETTDGSVAKVTINGATYTSDNGPLFLISTQSEKPEVRQLVADVGSLPTKANEVREYALANPDISAFFTEAKITTPVE